ncbi:MAG: hypothetical protein BGO26_17445 [Actinobacteria bacterium 69-20]|jgi:hypothetical protein|nr:hypothetical protein [Actinomycetota bacterium]OJV26004.1 MAG: hypothetical protein BGO26_17445 [Actinobacteria bacterium 69-20]
MSGPIVLERTIAVHHRLRDAGIPNAVGGALALAYHVDDPRATQDIDINVWVPGDRASDVLDALPADVPWTDETLAVIARDEQVRIFWPVASQVPIPLDLFFASDELHRVAAQRCLTVPMLKTSVEILSATDLAVFKALFDRPKDWPDILALRDAHDSTLDLAEAIRWVTDLVGADDDRVRKLGDLCRHTAG